MPLPTENQISTIQRVANIGLTYPAILKEIRDNRTAASVVLVGQNILGSGEDTSAPNYAGALVLAGAFVLIGLLVGLFLWRR